jgi:hypothetical protein
VIYSIPTRGFTAAVSVFRGTPPAKPLDCKILFVPSGGAANRTCAYHVGDDSKLVFADFSLSPEDYHLDVVFVLFTVQSAFVIVSVIQGK